MCTHYITFTINIPIPDWAEWMAQDIDGSWFVYRMKPRIKDNSGVWIGHPAKFIAVDEPNPNWQDALYKIEREK